MIEEAQLELARTLWEQSRTAALQAHEAWALVMKSQKSLMNSMRDVGMPFEMAANQFDKLMDFHSQQYKAALEFMDKMSDDYRKALEQQKK